MCSTYFDEGSIMDKYYQGQGDLADILRPTTNPVRSDSSQQAASTMMEDPPPLDWGFLMQHGDPVMHREEVDDYDFGDPFSNMKDPLLHELELVIPCSSSFFGSSISEDSAINSADDRGIDLGVNSKTYPIMSALYTSPPIPSTSPQQDPSTSVAAMPFESLERPLAHMEVINPNSRGRLIDTTTDMQISAQNSSMKRRKGQAKKVVFIPAPAAAVNGRAGSEVVPSDLWAWRKYGQKPIKGSPYPRGYYRCSSSKGCSARKQVERSRTDPNMLVITYTSEHNHPWPTQRNVLAGSTRATQSSNRNNGGSNAAPKVSTSSSPRDKRPNDTISTSDAVAEGSLGEYVKVENERSEEGVDRGRCNNDDGDDDFLFRELEGMDGGSDPVSFLPNIGGPSENSRPKGDTAGSDSFVNFFDWSD